MTLDFQSEQLRDLLYQVSDIVVRLYADIGNKPICHGKSPSEVHDYFEEPLPIEPQDIPSLLERVENQVFETTTLSISPHQGVEP